MRSDTDCEGASESDSQTERAAQTAQKKTSRAPRRGVTTEDQSNDQDELVGKYRNMSLAGAGTVKME